MIPIVVGIYYLWLFRSLLTIPCSLLNTHSSCLSFPCVPKLIMILSGHLYLSGVWLGMNPRIDTKKKCVDKILVAILSLSLHLHLH